MPLDVVTETDYAKGIRDGRIQSGQRVGNSRLYAMRITGTGAAYRLGLDEYCWRDPDVYLTPEFLERCNGLPVIFEHPKGNVLDSKEFGERVVGSIVLPYIKGDEVWGIARIQDDDVIDLLGKKKLSTSPTVIFGKGSENRKISLDDGTTVLLEGKPAILDHLAICKQGVWDKGGDPAGINSGVSDVAEMTEEEKKKADAKAKADAEAKAKADAEMPPWAASMADSMKSLADSVAGCMSRMDAYDKAKADAEMTEAEKAKAAEEKEKAKVDKAKADEEAEKEEKAKADSAALKARIDAMEARTAAEPSDEEVAAMADAQARCDSVASMFGKSARRPMPGETPLAYRRRNAKDYQQHCPAWKDVDLSLLPDAALINAEMAIYADAQKAAMAPGSVPAGELREIRRRDASGRVMIEFAGDPSAWTNQFKPAMRMRLTGLKTPNKGA